MQYTYLYDTFLVRSRFMLRYKNKLSFSNTNTENGKLHIVRVIVNNVILVQVQPFKIMTFTTK